MAVPSSLSDLSTTAASNSPAGSESIGTSLDDYLRAIQAIIKQGVSKGSDITAASTISPVATSSYFVVTGNTGISGISDSWTGRVVVLKFSGTPTLTHSASLILPGAANITAAAGDVASFVNESTGVWRCVNYTSSPCIIGTTVQAYVAAASQGEMEAGTESALRSMSPLRVAQAIAALASSGMPSGYISGLVLSNNGTDANNDIDIATGAARDASDAADMVLSSALTKRLDAAWAVGTNQGGLDTGSEATSTWYHVWLIKRSDTGVVDVLFSTSASAPTMPTNYNYKRRIGAVYNNSSGNIDGFLAFEQGGSVAYRWKTPPLDLNAVSQTAATWTNRTISAPLGIKVEAFGRVRSSQASTGNFAVRCPDASDGTPASGASPLGVGYSGTSVELATSWREFTNTSSQIQTNSESGITTSLRLVTLGYIDGRTP